MNELIISNQFCKKITNILFFAFLATSPLFLNSQCALIVDCSNITDQQIECRADLPSVDFTLPIVVDSCGTVTRSALTIIPGNSGCPGDTTTITRTYSLNDGTSQEECMQTFKVVSSILPTVTCPADTTIACGDNTSPTVLGTATGTASCSAATISFSDVSTQTPTGCTAFSYIITRTWVATDACDRTASCDQIITVEDILAPTFDQMEPADMAVECSSIPTPPTITAADNCTSVSPIAFINEVHYDNAGTDVGEFVEVAGTAGFGLDNCILYLYNGSDNLVYRTRNLSGTIDNEGAGFGAVSFVVNGIQNGSPDGIALVCDGVVLDFVSYEGQITAADGPAMGMTSTDIGTEANNTPIGQSLQLSGMGCSNSTFTWGGPVSESPGSLNVGQVFDSNQCTTDNSVPVVFTEVFTPGNICPSAGILERTWTATDACGNAEVMTQIITVEDTTPPVICDAPADLDLECTDPIPAAPVVTAFDLCGGASSIWINEFHYDNAGGDVNEFIEIAGLAGTDLSSYTIEFYNGANGNLYNTLPLAGIIPSETCGYGAIAFPVSPIMNGGPDGFALVQGTNVIEFLSYEGTFTAGQGTANGMTSTEVGADESTPSAIGESVQLIGMGSSSVDFTWSGPTAESPGSINEGQMTQGSIIATLTETISAGTCASSQIITRTWNAVDDCGNVATPVVQTITIDDTTPAMAVCQDVTIQLDETGMATIVEGENILIDGGSSDNCTPVDELSLVPSKMIFSCLDIAPNTVPGCAATQVVTLTVTDACGNISECIANVTVEDNIAPVLTCPNDLTIALDAGECGYVHYFTPPFAVDNCEGILTTTFLGTTFIDNNGFAGNMFDITNTSAGALTITMFDIHLGSALGTSNEAEVWYTSNTYVGNETNAAAWTSMGSSFVTSAGPGNPTPLPVGGLVLQPGESYGIYVAQIDGGSDIDYTNGNNTYTDPNLLISTGAGKGNPAFTGGTFASRTWNGNIHYTVVTGNMTTVTQTGGTTLTSGDYFEIGSYSWTYQADDGCGNVSECTYVLEVIEYPIELQTKTLTCNNTLNISLNQDCEVNLGADMILEGGPYMCYDQFVISVNGIVNNTITSPGTYTVSIMDPNTGNSCWGTINVEDKLAPVMDCPTTLDIKCFEYGALKSGEIEVENVVITDCSGFTFDFSDSTVGDDCSGRTVTRTFLAVDPNGYSSTCITTINVSPLDVVTDIINPIETVFLTCGAGTSPAEIAAFYDDPLTKDNTTTSLVENNEGYAYGYPTYMLGDHPQKVDGEICNFIATYTDSEIDACGAGCHGNVKIVRRWKYINWCTTEISEFRQIIKASDTEAPTFSVKDTVVSTRPWDCTADFMLPSVWELHDGCDIAPSYYVTGPAGVVITPKAGGGYQASGAPKGIHNFFYTAYDCCGNERTDTVVITVLDKVAPIVTTKRDIVVSLTPGGPGADGQAKLYCIPHIDNGSWDVCTPTHCEIRRADGAPQCGNDGDLSNGVPYNNNVTFNNTSVRFQTGNHPNDNRLDTDGGEFVKFCCEDLESVTVDANDDGVIDDLDKGYVMVIIRVWDDANMSGVFGDEVTPYAGVSPQRDNYNEGWAFVKVEDKLPPVIACPADATIYCDWGIDLSSDFGGGFQSTSLANFDKTGVAEAYSTCGAVEVFFNDNVNVNDCGVGTIIRQFQASTESKTGPKVVTCQQTITVLPRPTQFMVSPPNPNPLSVGCTLTQSDLDRRLPSVSGGACDVIGENVKVDTFLFENGVCKKWVAEYNYMNWCTGESMGPFFAYFVYEDTQAPVLENCEDQMYGVDANCQAFLTVTNNATDGGGCTTDGWLKWQLFVDTWGDGTVGHYASSFVSATTYRNWRAVAGTDPLLPAGHTYNDVVYVKYIEPTASAGGEVSMTMDQEVIEGKMSNHKVHWKVTDGCHNHTSCSYDVMIADKKAPTPYCVSLSSALMETGGVELWARDFDKGSFDNCSDQADLLFTFNEMSGAFKDTIIRVGNRDYLVNADVPQYFDADGFVDFDGDGVTYPAAKTGTINSYNSGDIQKWVPSFKSSAKVFDCDEYESQGPNGVAVKMSVWDKKCNTDFCVVYLTLVDNQGACTPGNGSRVAGAITTEAGEDLADVTVTIEGNVNDLTRVQTVTGAFDFVNLPNGVDYEVTASKDVDYMNGVSTLDLVMIQRHILGLQELTSANKLIAADVNNDMNIRANDLVELRKLILGVTNDFTATSWKLVDANEAVAMSTPLQYTEVVYADNLQSDVTNANFVAIKVGDVNGNAKANIRSNTSEPRSAKTITLQAEEQVVVAGQSVSVAITSANFNEVFGYQFTTELNGLSLNGVRAGAIEMTDANIAVLESGIVTASWASENLATVASNEVLFTLDFTATTAGNVSEMMNITSSVTTAESYVGTEMNVSDIELTFRTETATTANYALFQNEPNPFKDVTTVTYEMAEAGQATFTLYDVTGKVLVVKNEAAVKGMNTVEFNSNEISASGIVYYQIESGDYTATKKMIIIE